MDKKSWIVPVLIFLPLVFGALASFLAQWIWNPVPLLVFKIDVGMVAFVSGVVITLFFGAAYLNGWVKEQSAQKTIEQSMQESEQDASVLSAGSIMSQDPLTGRAASSICRRPVRRSGGKHRKRQSRSNV
jgi:hypothetical protein